MYGSDLRCDKYSYTDALMAPGEVGGLHHVLGGGGGGREGGGGGVLSLPGAEHTRGMSRMESAQVMNEQYVEYLVCACVCARYLYVQTHNARTHVL